MLTTHTHTHDSYICRVNIVVLSLLVIGDEKHDQYSSASPSSFAHPNNFHYPTAHYTCLYDVAWLMLFDTFGIFKI